jgi:putative toxin-antitoxin system antitoxin component (TIGR02293 family)
MAAPAPADPPAPPRDFSDFLEAVGADAHADPALVSAVRRGLPLAAIDRLRQWGILAAEIERLVIPRRTLAHRRKTGQPLSPVESERALRVARVVSLADRTFGDRDKSDVWLRRPTRVLAGEAPLAAIDSEPGARLVEDLLVRIDHGIAA